MGLKKNIQILLDDEERIQEMLRRNQGSLVEFIQIPIREVLRNYEKNSEGLKIEEIISKVNSKGYDFDTKRIANVLTNLISEEIVEFRSDYTYVLSEKPETKY